MAQKTELECSQAKESEELAALSSELENLRLSNAANTHEKELAELRVELKAVKKKKADENEAIRVELGV